jgi:hypothetical protein
MGTPGRENHLLPRIFKGREECSGRPPNRDALPAVEPYLRINRFQGHSRLKRKDNSSQNSYRRLRVRLRCRADYPPSHSRILTGFPFDEAANERGGWNKLPPSLRSDSPMFNCCSHGTLLHFSLQSFHLNNCYCHQDLHRRPFHPGSRQRLPHGSTRPPTRQRKRSR